MLAATFGLLFVSGGAIAAQSGSQRSGPSSDAIKAAQSALGVAADGVVGPRTRAATKRFQRENGLSVDGVIGPQTLGALGIKSGTTTARSAKENDPVLERIAACESSGDPTAVSPDGRYHGKYQFSLATWREMGGKGNPARASEAEQDRLAAKLLDRRGTAPWPNCA
ncbi:MAG: transglycosylase family protein [Solirubrobacteraceae bacterium]|nr:transglycosylase family protein [Solirubrobacteraceae bacterium]